MAADYNVQVNLGQYEHPNIPLVSDAKAVSFDQIGLADIAIQLNVELGQFYDRLGSEGPGGGGGSTRPTSGLLYPRGLR